MSDIVTAAPAAGDPSAGAPPVSPEVGGVGGEPVTQVDGGGLLGSADEGSDPKPASAWPADWREQLANGDADVAKRLARYTDPKNVIKSWIEAQKKLTAGPQPKPDAEDTAALAEWRKREGIPDKPDGYKVPDIEGFKWTDADKPALVDFLTFAHTADMRPQDVKTALQWYGETQRKAAEAQATADRQVVTETRQALIDTWGAEFTSNKRLAEQFVESTPLGKALYGARLADGRVLGSVPEFIQWAAEQGRMTYGDSAFIGADGGSTMAGRKEEIERVMRSDLDRYYRDGLDKELNKIIEAEMKTRRR